MGKTIKSSIVNTTSNLYFHSPIGRGPILRSLRKRAFVLWLIVAVLGLLPLLYELSPAWRAAGLGLWLPGGGFLYTAHPGFFALSLLCYIISLLLWLLMGGFIFPIIVWSGAAALAALSAGDTVWAWAEAGTPIIALSIVTISLLMESNKKKKAVPRAEKLKEYIEAIPFSEPIKDSIIGEELSDQELGAMRYTLDLALQPINEFEGFVTIDQFREAAWRYQLFHINYALGILQTCRIPAFRGYLHEAQRRSIVKTLDRRVWKYWRIENFVGNLRLDADPVIKENIMYSGWFGLALGAFERATGDLRFSQPGALTLIDNPNKKYVYDYHSMMKAVASNFDAHKLHLFPCEPNWVFSICNLFGMTGMLVHDRIHGTRLGLDRLDQFNRIMEEEFTTAEGKTVMIVSKRSGFRIAFDAAEGFAANAQLMNMTSPRQAQVYWELFKYIIEEKYQGDRSQWGAKPGPDAGNYKLNRSGFWTSVMRGAKEIGDDKMYNFAKEGYDKLGIEDKDGALHWEGSVLMQLTSHMARWGTKDAWHRMAHGEVPEAINNGPILNDAPYPDVLVAAANNDGEKLELVLCAGTEPGVFEIELARLIPSRKYRVLSSDKVSQNPDSNEMSISANSEGVAKLALVVNTRTKVSVRPV